MSKPESTKTYLKTYIYLYTTGRACVQYEGASPSLDNRAPCLAESGAVFNANHEWYSAPAPDLMVSPARELASLMRLESLRRCRACCCQQMTFKSTFPASTRS